MAIFTAAAFALRKKLILEALGQCGARTPETAKSLEEAEVINPDKFPEYTEKLVLLEVIRETPDHRYYLP